MMIATDWFYEILREKIYQTQEFHKTTKIKEREKQDLTEDEDVLLIRSVLLSFSFSYLVTLINQVLYHVVMT